MVSQETIIAILLAFFITGVIPAITGIVLLASRKLKGSAFWYGILSALAATIIVLIPALATQGGNPAQEGSAFVALQLLNAAVSAAALALGVMVILKKSRDFKGAVSCGIGYGMFYSISIGLQNISLYVTAAMINSGTFESMYAPAIESRRITREQVIEIKRQIIEFTALDSAAYIISALAGFMLYTALCLIFMKGIFANKKAIALLAGVCVSLACTVPVMLFQDNLFPASLAGAVISLVTLVISLRFRKSLSEALPSPAPKPDSFMNSIDAN
ncbi:MAG: YhfC family glutamic-type intramembrane protease [Oscillospiraceae bacterium]|nr:YhfC family glutamic-type intramembrane protease [Oscillospiraceae bacterium]